MAEKSNTILTIQDLKKQNVSFEDAYKELENLIKMQEQGEISLEDSIAYYKKGKILISYCEELLNKANVVLEEVKP